MGAVQVPYFDVFGPYSVQMEDRVCSNQNEFWKEVESNEEGLSRAIGCYLFCMVHGQRFRPWYVGMTIAERGFRGELFQEHKTTIYNECIGKQRGSPVIFVLPLMTDGHKFSQNRTLGKRAIDWLEITLMGFAHRQNPEISNVRDMHFLRNIEVIGLLGKKRKGRPFKEVKDLRRALLHPN